MTLLDQFKVSDSPAKFSLLDSLEDDLKGTRSCDLDRPIITLTPQYDSRGQFDSWHFHVDMPSYCLATVTNN